MNLQALPLPYALGAISGLSERLMSSHHQNNYGGAVKRLNAIRAQLAATSFASTPGFVLNGLKREELIAANSAFLHELYFDNLGGNGVLPSCGLSIALTRDFGSVDAWRSQFIGLARAMPQPRSGPSITTVCGSAAGIQPPEPAGKDQVPWRVRVVSRPRSTQISCARACWCQSTSRARPCGLSKRKPKTGGPSSRSNQSSS
mgnify:CR=1 FL=1